ERRRGARDVLAGRGRLDGRDARELAQLLEMKHGTLAVELGRVGELDGERHGARDVRLAANLADADDDALEPRDLVVRLGVHGEIGGLREALEHDSVARPAGLRAKREPELL